jgi:ABC-type polysaccharide/polyol phosphate export permease
VDVALHVVNLVLGASTWVFFGKSFEAANPVYQQYGGDFVSFLILGLMLNSFYTYTLDAFRMATLFILRGRVGSIARAARGNYPIALLGIFIGWVAVAGIGLISASMITIIGAWKGTEPVRWLVGVLTGLVSGVYFPFEVLPEQLQMISRVLPQTYAMRIARLALLQGFGLSELWADLTVLTLIALILLP